MSGGYFLSSFSKAGQALGVREFCVSESGYDGDGDSRPHSGRLWDNTLPFCVAPMAG